MTIGEQNELNAEIRHQDWGRDNPIPELETLLDVLNQDRKNPTLAWYELRNRAYRNAARLLGVPRATSRGDDSHNATIDALTLYRADWRGYTVSNSRGGAL